MPHIKNALIRYRILDRAIGNKYNPYPNKQQLRELCEEDLFGSTNGSHICDSTIEKDLFAMKMEHDAPIKYSRKYHGYYYTDENYSLNDTPLSVQDLESISFAVNTLKQFRDVSMFRQFGQAIDKIVDRVAVESKQPLDDNNEVIPFELAFSEGSNDFLGTNSVGGVRNVELQLKCLRFASFLYSEHIDVDSIRQQNQYYLDVVSDYLNTGKLDSHSSAVVVSFFRQCVASASDPLLQLNSDDLDLIQERLDFLLKDDVEDISQYQQDRDQVMDSLGINKQELFYRNQAYKLDYHSDVVSDFVSSVEDDLISSLLIKLSISSFSVLLFSI